MAIVFDPITQRQVTVPDPPLPSAPPPPMEHVFVANTPPSLPPEIPQALVNIPAPLVPQQGSSAAAPPPETDLPNAPPPDPTLGSNVDSIV